MKGVRLLMKKIVKITKQIAEKNLKREANSLCIFLFYQPNEPAEIKRFKHKR